MLCKAGLSQTEFSEMTFHFYREDNFLHLSNLLRLAFCKYHLIQSFFQETVVDYILHNNVESLKPTTEEIPEESIKRSLTELDKVENELDFKNKASFERSF